MLYILHVMYQIEIHRCIKTNRLYVCVYIYTCIYWKHKVIHGLYLYSQKSNYIDYKLTLGIQLQLE